MSRVLALDFLSNFSYDIHIISIYKEEVLYHDAQAARILSCHAENGSITKAANSLRISQPPLSLQLKGLEEELGCQLFIRDKKNMIITPKGILRASAPARSWTKVNETLLLMQSANEEERYTIPPRHDLLDLQPRSAG